jgi:hypothetical protein
MFPACLAVFVGVAVIRSSLRDAAVFVILVGGASLAYLFTRPSPKKQSTTSPSASKAAGSSSSAGRALILHISGGPLDDQRHTVTSTGAKCGRHTSNAIVLPEAAVSRHHFSIQYKAADQGYYLVDEGSTTGRESAITALLALTRTNCRDIHILAARRTNPIKRRHVHSRRRDGTYR